MTNENRKVLENDILMVNKALENCKLLLCTGSETEKVLSAENYALSAGGKRIRPVLCMEFYKLFGGKDNISDIAIALEMIHTFSLIHDDMPEMDDDDLRRGRPSTHIAYGQDVALLAGDGLSLLPFEIISSKAIEGKISYETATKLVYLLSNAAGSRGMIMGQMLDIYSEEKEIDTEYLTNMSMLKTGCLLKASTQFGAALAGADDEKMRSAETYAENLGLAFQIVDDVLDVIGNQELLGKPIGSDKDRSKQTFADILGIDGALDLAREYTEKAVNAVRSYNGSEFLCELALHLLDRKK